jgi:hypothetical protein
VPLVTDAQDLATDLAQGLSLSERSKRLDRLIETMRDAPVDELDAAVHALMPALAYEDPYASGLAALAVGCLVETGADPSPPFPAVLARVTQIVEAAERFVIACRRELREDAGAEGHVEAPILDHHTIATIGGSFVAAPFLHEIAVRDPLGARAWDRLDDWFRPLIALASRSEPLREIGRTDAKLAVALQRLEQVDEMSFVPIASLANTRTGARLKELLDIGHLEMLVLVPAYGRGFRALAKNVTDGGQLHVLLAHELVARGIPGKPRDEEELAVCRGHGPQVLPRLSYPTWATFPWTAMRADGSLPPADASLAEDRVPQAIPALDGERVLIVGGEPAPDRNFRTQRSFEGLRASIEVEELAPEDVARWLTRVRDASSSLQRQ